MKYEFIKQEVVVGTHVLTILREDQSNKLHVPSMLELMSAMHSAERDEQCKAIVLTARGDYFCNGGELGDYRIKSPMEIREFGDHFVQLHVAITRLAKPVIAAVQGHALGGGLSLVEACDLAVASRNAKFGVPEIRSGLAPMMSLTGLVRILSRKPLMELSLFGDEISAEKAREIGLINYVCEPDEVLNKALEISGKLSVFNPVALTTCKRLYYEADGLTYQRQLECGLDMLVTLLKSKDAMEALTASVELREPQWSGV